MARKINWTRVCANFGLAFFSTLSGAFTISGLLKVEVPFIVFLSISLFVAFIQGGMAFFVEMLKETEEKPKEPGCTHGLANGKNSDPPKLANGKIELGKLANGKKGLAKVLSFLIAW